MVDLAYVAVVAVFFAASSGLVELLDALGRSKR